MAQRARSPTSLVRFRGNRQIQNEEGEQGASEVTFWADLGGIIYYGPRIFSGALFLCNLFCLSLHFLIFIYRLHAVLDIHLGIDDGNIIFHSSL